MARALFPSAAAPPCWPAVERAKFLSRDGAWVFKFEGLGGHGDGARARAEALSGAGFLPPGAGTPVGAGYLATPWLRGRPLGRADLSPGIIDLLADGCAFRAAAFPAAIVDQRPLEEMVRFNAAAELGLGLEAQLPIERPVIPDARMAPHELFLTEAGALYKLDSVSDGDDHLLPGPTDVAWDLAGAVFEWGLSEGAQAALLARYRARSGDDAAPRLPLYLLAYGLFRTAYWKMAAAASAGQPDERALLRAYERARGELLRRTGHRPGRRARR